jgi:hypothetical protein
MFFWYLCGEMKKSHRSLYQYIDIILRVLDTQGQLYCMEKVSYIRVESMQL